MTSRDETMRAVWEESFAEAIARSAYNTAPVEALIRNVSYYLRDRHPDGDHSGLRFIEMGCGAGPNLVWLAEKGIRVSGVDISPTALDLARGLLSESGHSDLTEELVEASVSEVPLPDQSFDGILESCVFQHLAREDRERAFAEVGRLLKPGGLFVGNMLGVNHTIYRAKQGEDIEGDPGTLMLEDGSSKIHLSDIGLSHFFSKDEYDELLRGFSVVDPCLSEYELPREEAARRGYDTYLQSMWTVYAIK
jgi:ubiquinone/menaquinone biosynthesis C-methylase UbiE